MATSTPVASRLKKAVRKLITFDAGTGSGAVGTVAALTVTGTVWVQVMNIHCVTDLTGASATISLGISGDTAALIPVTVATTIDAGFQWNSTVPGKIDEPLTNFVLSNSLILTIAAANVTGGSVEIEIVFDSLSADGYIS